MVNYFTCFSCIKLSEVMFPSGNTVCAHVTAPVYPLAYSYHRGYGGNLTNVVRAYMTFFFLFPFHIDKIHHRLLSTFTGVIELLVPNRN